MKQERWGEAVLPGLIVVYIIAYLSQTYDLPFQTVFYPFMVIGLLVMLLLLFGVQQWLQARTVVPQSREVAPEVAPEVASEVVGEATNESSLAPHTDLAARALAVLSANRRAVGVVVFTFSFPHVVAHLGFFFTATIYLSLLFWLFKTLRPAFVVPLAMVLSGGLAWVLLGVVQLNFPRFEYAELPWYF